MAQPLPCRARDLSSHGTRRTSTKEESRSHFTPGGTEQHCQRPSPESSHAKTYLNVTLGRSLIALDALLNESTEERSSGDPRSHPLTPTPLSSWLSPCPGFNGHQPHPLAVKLANLKQSTKATSSLPVRRRSRATLQAADRRGQLCAERQALELPSASRARGPEKEEAVIPYSELLCSEGERGKLGLGK